MTDPKVAAPLSQPICSNCERPEAVHYLENLYCTLIAGDLRKFKPEVAAPLPEPICEGDVMCEHKRCWDASRARVRENINKSRQEYLAARNLAPLPEPTLVCNKCGRTVSTGGSIRAGNGCNISTFDGHHCAGIFEVSPLPEIASPDTDRIGRHLVKRMFDEVGPEKANEFINRVLSNEHDVPSPWDSQPRFVMTGGSLWDNELQQFWTTPSPVPLGEPLFRVQTPSDARVEEIKQEIIREFEPALATKTLGEPAQTEETVDELIATLKPHTAYVEMEIRLGLGRIQITDIEDKIASENWGKQNKAYLDLRSQRCRELRLIRVAYELLLERNAALATKAVPIGEGERHSMQVTYVGKGAKAECACGWTCIQTCEVSAGGFVHGVAAEHLQSRLRSQEGPRWISVKERLPAHRTVVRTFREGYQDVAVYREGQKEPFQTHNAHPVEDVTHWKELDWPYTPPK